MDSRRSFHLMTVLRLGGTALLLAALLVSGCSDDETDPVSSSSELPDLVVTPQTVVLSSMEGSAYNERVHVRVDCEPYDNVAFRFGCESSWMSVSNLDGTEVGVTRDSFAINFDIVDLGAGEHVDSVRLVASGAGNSPQYIEVTCSIIPIPPDLAVEPLWLEFSAASLNEVVPPETLKILCADGSSMSYSVEESADWISLSGSDGVTPDTLEVMVDMSGLTTGLWVDTIRVTSEEMSNSPINVVCSLFTPVWQQQTHTFENHVLEDVVFADENTGWAVGYLSDLNKRSGYLLETFDGGTNWEMAEFLNAAYPGDSMAFVAVEAIDPDAWAITEHGVLYHSGNQGDTWDNAAIAEASGYGIRGMSFATADVGWIIGTDGLILKTSDGGDNWTPQESNTDEELLALSIVDENHGWIIGYHNVLRYTIDGGDTWTELTGPLSNCRDIFFVNANTGWMVGSGGNILRTDDGGVNWASQESGVDVWLQSVHFVDGLQGWAAGQDGVVLHTEDAGETWHAQVSGSSAWLQSVFFLDELRGWVSGNYGEIRFTTSGGQ